MPEAALTLTEFAERVLFSATVEEKLAPPIGVLSDEVAERPRAPSGVTPLPGRPSGLIWRTTAAGTGSTAGRSGLPATPSLVNDERRGELLHFFANHELLATELMALVLLKFPDAPSGFRQDVLATLLEEQNHTKWYLGRMQQCGVAFGDLPVSGFFWNAVAPMETPLDYVTRLSLTFEQANLDYARYFAGIMRDAGDPRTAGILDRIYRDEIAHVGTGLKWFRRWKTEGRSDWEEFQDRLAFPLSPSRAKANRAAPFNSEGRLAAGLDEAFVRALASFERSNGRTPNVFWACFDAERQMAESDSGKSYHPNKAVLELADDLECLPAFLARPDDVILVRRPPSLEHLERLQSLGFVMPEFEQLNDRGDLQSAALIRERKIHALRPWACCPSSAAMARDLAPNAAREMPQWSEPIRQLFCKSAWSDYLGGPGVTIDDARQLEVVAAELNASTLVLKAPFAASGSGNQRWEKVDASAFAKIRATAKRVIGSQGSALIEPWHERVFDFSVQFEMPENPSSAVRKVGLVRLHNRRSGAFVACSTGPKFCRGLAPSHDPELGRFLMTKALPRYEPDSALLEKIAQRCRAAGYHGPLGIDAYIYRDESGALALREVCEINPRYTMGRLALELQRKVAAGHWVRFSIERSVVDAGARQERSPQLDAVGKFCAGKTVLNEGGAWSAFLEVSKMSDFSWKSATRS